MNPGRMGRCGIINHVTGTRTAGVTGIYGKLIFGSLGLNSKGKKHAFTRKY